jgi:flagellar basal-body rod protein FlgB
MLVSASDAVAAALGGALDGLAMRQRVAADNIANMDTPGFTAATVDFETSLRAAIADGALTRTGDAAAGDAAASGAAAGDIAPTLGVSDNQPGADGNNVDLASETMTAMQSTFQYQLLTRAVGDRYSLITTAIGGM